MTRLLIAVLLFASFNAAAQTNVPNDLNDGEVASAEEVMQNFQALEDAIDNNAESIGFNTTGINNNASALSELEASDIPASCELDQIIKWDGSAWVCASRLSGSITLIQKWYAWGHNLGQDNNEENMFFFRDEWRDIGMWGGANSMYFRESEGGLSYDDGFVFPEAGIYKVDVKMHVQTQIASPNTTQVIAHYTRTDNTGQVFWEQAEKIYAWIQNYDGPTSGYVYTTASASFTLNITDALVQRLRFEFAVGDEGGRVAGGPNLSWVTFTRIEP